MLKPEKERVVAELTERLRTSQTIIVADYRGLRNSQIDGVRTELLKHGARFSVVKNTLTRRAAEAAGADALLALLEGPTAIAFLEADGDPVAVAKALGAAARDTRILTIRGGLLEGRPMSSAEVESLATLPPLEVLRGQVIGAVIAPLNQLLALVNAPLQNLYGLIDARIDQLGGQAETASDAGAAAEAESTAESPGDEPQTVETDATQQPDTDEPAAADATEPASSEEE